MIASIAGILAAMSCYGSAAAAPAGTEGHGGQVVVSYDASHAIQSISLRDYYEGVNTYTSKLDFAGASGTYTNLVDAVLARLALVDPVASARFQSRASSFLDNASFISNSQIEQIGDATQTINPGSNCYYEQLAVQMFDLKEGQKSYYVDQDLWKLADDKTKAGLILHEVVLTDAVNDFGQQTSDGTRYYNYMISSDFMNQVSIYDYGKVLEGAFPEAYSMDGFDMQGFSYKVGSLVLSNPYLLNNGSVFSSDVQSGELKIGDRVFSADEMSNVGLTLDGSIAPCFSGIAGFSAPGGFGGLKTRATLDSNGKLVDADLAWNAPFQVQGQSVTLQTTSPGNYSSVCGNRDWSGDYDVSFYPDGTLKCARIAGGVQLKGSDGQIHDLDNGFLGLTGKIWDVQFDANGILTSSKSE